MQQKWQPVSYFYLLKRAENFRAIFIWSRKWHTQNYTYCPCHLDENILLKYWLYNIFEKGQQQHTFIYLCKICKIHRLSLLTLGTISASFASCLEDHLLKIGLNGLKKYLFAHQFQPCCPFELSDSQHSDKLVLWLSDSQHSDKLALWLPLSDLQLYMGSISCPTYMYAWQNV